MKYKLSAEKTFSSAHALRGYKGKCEHIHGHNWKVKVTIGGNKLNEIGILIDFGQIKSMLSAVLNELDHKDLNQIKPFDKINPSAENIADLIYKKMKERMKKEKCKNVYLMDTTVWESENTSATAVDEP